MVKPNREAAAKPIQPRLLTKPFLCLCAATALGYAHHALLTPVLPLFIQHHGGTASLVGLVTAAFSVTSFVLRPFIGRAVDRRSPRGVMLIGTLVLGLSSIAYLVYHAFVLLLVRAVHGTAWAAYNTGAKVLVSSTAPTARRGEASGYFSMAQSIATALVPAIALWILALVGFAGVFLFSAAGGLLATVAGLGTPGHSGSRRQSSSEGLWDNLVDRSVLLPSVLEFLTKMTQPAAAIFIPLYAVSRGISIESVAYYYLGFGVVGIAARGVLGRLSDRFGRARMIGHGAIIAVLAMVITSHADDIAVLTLGGALFGLANAAAGPSVMALAIDLAPPERLGAAMATYSMAFQLAQGLGAVLGGLLIDFLGFRAMYLTMAAAPLAAGVIALKSGAKENPSRAAPAP